MSLEEFFIEHPKAAIAFSGGVDSAYLLYAANKYAKEFAAYYVKTAFQPDFELNDALKLSRELGARLHILCLDVLSCEQVASNPPDRCYYCKRRLFEAIAYRAHADGFDVLLDGTNASDDEGDRPGMKALSELSVLSPLRICGLTKAEIRELSREAGLFTWDKPAYACLATRHKKGQRITLSELSRTEAAEGFMAGLGFRNFRIRTIGNSAKIQVTSSQFPLLEDQWETVCKELSKSYDAVTIDTEVRNEQ